MEDAPLILLGIALAVFVVIVAPILALVSWTKIRRLERRVDELSRRGLSPAVAFVPVAAPAVTPSTPAAAAAAAVPVAPVAPTPTPVTVTAVPVPSISPAPVAAARPSKGSTDLERVIAGRWLFRIGLIAVTVGVGFFLKAAIDNEWIGPGGQVALGLLLGAAVIASSTWFLKHGYRYFADGITALGAAILYLSLWAASGYYQLIPPTAAFAAMVVVTAGIVMIALGRNSQRVAALGMIGGFVTPMLVSTGQDAQIALFSYIALQDAVLLVLAYQRDWRWLELPAFLFTQAYFWGWYNEFYVTTALARTMAFASLFYVVFAVLPVIRSRRRGAFRGENGLVMFLNVSAFLITLQVLLWPEHRWLLTVATLALATFHLIAVRTMPGDQLLPRLLFGGLALTLVTLAIPMRLTTRDTTMAWAIEAAVLMWIGFRVRIWQIRTAAFILFAIVMMMVLDRERAYPLTLWNAQFGALLLAVVCAYAALAIARAKATDVVNGEKPAFAALAVAANLLLLQGVTSEITLYHRLQIDAGQYEAIRSEGLMVSLFWTLFASALVGLGVATRSALMRWQGLVLFGLTTLKVFLVDLSGLAGVYRILSAIALGVVLLIVSFFYQRKLAAGHREEGA